MESRNLVLSRFSYEPVCRAEMETDTENRLWTQVGSMERVTWKHILPYIK